VTKFPIFLFILSIFIASAPLQGAEDDLYDFLWLDQDKKVFVLQNKVYKKDKTFYADFGYLRGLSSDYQNTSGFQIRSGYYFLEEWAVELIFNQYNNSNNDTYNNLGRINGVVPFQRKFERNYGVAGVWTPFYGKINTFNQIIYFDWSFGAGVTKIDAESNAESAANPNSDIYKDESFTGLLTKSNLKFHLSPRWHVNIEMQKTFYKGKGPIASQPASWRTNTDVIFGIGFSF
jgi:outer membrane beta-barrel protein